MNKILLLFFLAAVPLAGLAQEGAGHEHHHGLDQSAPAWPADAGPEQLFQASFELLNGNNETVTEQDYRGRYLLLSFGFSSCKHICPTTLRDWSQMMKALPAGKAARLQAVMISLDPERDSPEHMDKYSKQFHPDFQGLSGSLEQVSRAAANFRVSFAKVPVGNDYQINHTSVAYLVDPQGLVIDYFGFGMPSQQLAGSIAGHIP